MKPKPSHSLQPDQSESSNENGAGVLFLFSFVSHGYNKKRTNCYFQEKRTHNTDNIPVDHVFFWDEKCKDEEMQLSEDFRGHAFP